MVGSLRIQLLFEHCHMATRSFLTTHSYRQGHRNKQWVRANEHTKGDMGSYGFLRNTTHNQHSSQKATVPLQDGPRYQGTVIDWTLHVSTGHVRVRSCLRHQDLHASSRLTARGTLDGPAPPRSRGGGCACLYAPSCLRRWQQTQ